MRIVVLLVIALALAVSVAVAGNVARDQAAGKQPSVIAERPESVMGPGYNPPPPWIPVS